jgi:hypothetical protein
MWLPLSAQEPLIQSVPKELPDSLDMVNGAIEEIEVGADEDEAEATEAVPLHRQRIEFDEAYDAELRLDSIAAETGERVQVFNPDATRAVWLSALCPGLGQLYNRRYWKLPIVVGAYMGLAYATSWNNSMLTDYTKAYRDLIDNDPDTKSYMDFFAPNVQESSLSKSWLENLFSSRKNYFRRNRDLCIISMVGVYLLAMVDAYVDASLAHFDISPDLTLDWSPMIVPETRSGVPSVGIQWALTF